MSRPSMSGHVKRLEAAGWIVRDQSADDGRRSGFQVTPSGAAQIDAIRQRRNDWLAVRLARLSPAARAALAAAQEPLLELLSIDA